MGAGTLERFFDTKTTCDVEGTMAYFSPGLASYVDATLGRDLDGYETLAGVFTRRPIPADRADILRRERIPKK